MITRSCLFLLPLALALTACGDTKSGEQMEDDIENAADDAGDAIERGADRAGDAIERGANDVAAAADDAGDRIDNAADNATNAGNNVASSTRRKGDEMTYLDQTFRAVKSNRNDLTAIPVQSAVSTIDGWLERLDGVDGMYEIRQGLKDLREELTERDKIDGKKVGTVLKGLGEDVVELDNPALKPLSDALGAAGTKLGGR